MMFFAVGPSIRPGTLDRSVSIMDFAPTVWAMAQLVKQMDVQPPGKKFVMEFLDPRTHKLWKSELHDGRADIGVAAEAGT